MADSRGESRASYAESTVLKQGIGETPDLFQQGIPHPRDLLDFKRRPSQDKMVLFAGEAVVNDKGDEQITLPFGGSTVVSHTMNLRDRLYNRPEDSQVIRIVQGNKPKKTEVISPIAPRPPVIKTMMFKRDYAKRQMELKAKHNPEALKPEMLSLQKLHKTAQPLLPPPSMQKFSLPTSLTDAHRDTTVDGRVKDELAVDSSEVIPPDTSALDSARSDDGKVKKEVKFIDDQENKDLGDKLETSPCDLKDSDKAEQTPRDLQDFDETEPTPRDLKDSDKTELTPRDLQDSEAKYPDEIPIIETQKLLKPLKPIQSPIETKSSPSLQERASSCQSSSVLERNRPSSGGSLNGIIRRPSSGGSLSGVARRPSLDSIGRKRPESGKSTRQVSATSGSRQQDPSLVLTYLKKNLYDDDVPENDDVGHHLCRMREKLGWTVYIPRHGPGSRKSMDKLTNQQAAEEEEPFMLTEDDGEFMYALPRNRDDPRARYNPYDLQIVSPNVAREQKIWWTISASSVTMCVEDGCSNQESLTTPALWWLWEKRLFYMIYEKQGFVQFRLWKTFKLWKKSVRQHKNKGSKGTLCKQLFLANEVLQGCLLHVRGLCEAASSSTDGIGVRDSAISLVRLDKTRTLGLTEFMEAQKQQGEVALKQITALRDKIITIVWESCATVAEMEGVRTGIRPGGSKKVKIEVPVTEPVEQHGPKYRLQTKYGVVPVQDPKSKEAGKRDRPLFAEIAEWRKILARLSNFLKTVDYLLLEFLRRLVITAMRQLLDFLVASFDAEVSDEESDSSDNETSGGESSVSSSKRPYSPGRSKMMKQFADGKVKQWSAKSDNSKQSYVIPKYDFDQSDEDTGPPDIDNVLEEIKQRDIIEEAISPVFFMELVLNVSPEKSRDHHRSRHRNSIHPSSSHSLKSPLLQSLATEESAQKKTVSFPDEPEISESDSESGYSEYSEYMSDEEEEDDDETTHQNRFAYGAIQRRESKGHITKAYISLSPSAHDLRDGIIGILAGFEQSICQVVSMLKEPRLAVFYSPPEQDLKLNYDQEELLERQELERPWPDTEFLFGEDPEYQALHQNIHTYMGRQIDLVTQFAKMYEQFCVMVDQCRQVDVIGSMSKRSWSTDEFSHVLRTHTEMVSAMDSMVIEQRVSMILIQAQHFCQTCLPFPSRVVQEIHDNLPLVANKRNEDLLTIIKGASRKLDHFPSSVEEFVEHLSFLGRMTSELPALDKEFLIVTKLFTIANDYSVKIEPEELAMYQTLGPSFQHLKSTILFCEAKKDDNIRKYSSHLDRLISNIRYKLMEVKNLVRDPNLLNGETIAVLAMENIRHLQEDVQSLSSRARSYASYQERFGSSLSQTKKFGEEYLLMDVKDDKATTQAIQSDLSEIERDLTLRRLLWQSQEEWSKLLDEWTATPFDSLVVEGLQKNVSRFTQTVYMLQKGLPMNNVLPRLKEKVMDFKQGMPVITSLRNPSLRPRHWAIIEKIIGKIFIRDKSFTLGNLLEMNIFKHKEKIQDISTTASNEATLELMLNKVIEHWLNTDFRLIAHSGRDTHIIAGADDIMAQLEEGQVTVGTIRGSRYVTPIKALVEEWERKLQVFSRTLDEWMTCQRNWLYLEQIFNTPDIQRQLPSEYKLFTQVDKAWKDIMRRVEDRPNALKSAIAPGTLETLQTCNINLEKIQKCLEDYLETKRLVFPRFYFLSNDELLDILAQSKDPNAVQPHLGKCFGNIRNLDIRQLPRQPPTVKYMYSAEGETISMPRNVRARGPVEQWLGSVENGMFESVKRHLKLGLSDWLGIRLQEWVLKHPGQVVLTVSQVMFNKNVVGSLNHFDPMTALVSVREDMVSSLNVLARMVTSNLQPHQRMSIEALLTINVHNRDIINTMIDNKVMRKDDFEWTKQLRYEWDEQTNNCQVLQSNASFQYGYEYLGCSARLVITPLTDRCYLTLMGAMHLHLGGSPAGPAGTGKTETVKDLAKAMGKQCVVFNCSEGLDFKMLGKFFSGLAQSGSWCCFDEFNRIDVEVLSVVAQQLHTIKTAKDAGAPRFVFEGRDIRLNMTCGYFITMNPTYAGRVELPDNLKSLFRSVAMMVPDYALIAEIMLFSEGFTVAKALSRKIVNLYQLASKQLSQQDHYDFGMRAIKSVLVMAGHGRRHAQLSIVNTDKTLSEEEESYILIHSLRDANLPKFLAEDVPLFESILADLFPGVIPPQPDYGLLEKAISMATRDQGLQHWPNQIEKIKQFHNQLLVRHGVMLVGPTGGGKTTVRSLLQRALVILPAISQQEATNKQQPGLSLVHNRAKKGHVETFAINPKCVKLGELYGETDPNTFEWTDGLIACATRKFARDTCITPVSGPEERTSSPGGATNTVSEAALSTKASSAVFGTDLSEAGHSDAPTSVTLGHHDDKKEIVDSTVTDWRWLIMDGPVDTLWVENLNTVLDDSKVLCLANGERIGLTNGMRLIFEVDNLSQASPATISRCAMVFMDPIDLGWRPYVKTWLQRLSKDIPESGKTHLQEMFDLSIDKGLKFFRQNKRFQHVPAPEMCLVSSLCHLLAAFFDFLSTNGGFGNPDQDDSRPLSADSMSSHHSRASSRSSSRTGPRVGQKLKKRGSKKNKSKEDSLTDLTLMKESTRAMSSNKQYYLQKNPSQLLNLLGKLFVFAYTWSIGGNFRRTEDYDDDSLNRRGADKGEPDINICAEFDNFLHELFEVEGPLGVRLPAGHRPMYSYFVDLESGNFVTWDNLIPSTKSLIEKGAVITIGESMGVVSGSQKKASSQDTDIVPTVDNVRFSFLAGLLLLNKHPVLLNGESGVGKTTILNNMLKRLSKEGGTLSKSGTVLGSILNYSEKSRSLLENISSLTKMGEEEDDDNRMELILGTTRPKHHTGLISSMIQFSAQTSSSRMQAQVIHRLIKKARDTLGAPKGRKVVVFVDDLNMPAPEVYGSQPPLELLRQFLEYGGFYDTKKLTWKSILDVTVVAACGPPGGGRNPVSPRLLKNFCMLALPHPSTRSLQHIYQVQLGRFFQDGEFMPEVTDSLFPIVSASIDIYYTMCANMLPTPAKSHYTFNIRDLSKVIQGVMRAHESVIVGRENCAQLFAHEVTRIFHDRLVSEEDKISFFAYLADNLHDYFKMNWTKTKLLNEQVLFGDFFDPDETDASMMHIYRPMTDRNKLTSILEEYHMRMHLGSSQIPQMVFFKDAVEHITRAVRVFGQPGGHMVMVGIDGTGKSTIVNLSSHIAGCELFKLTLHRQYGTEEFREDLKRVYRLAGVKGVNTIFLLTDGDIVQESFLEDVNCILNSGEVPDLFDNEELDGIAMELKSAAAANEVPDTRTSVFQFFMQRVKENLHVVLTMSPAGDKFRQRCRMNPALINCCTIDWYNEWTDQAMLSVANVFIQDDDFIADRDVDDIKALKLQVAQVCVKIHHSVRTAASSYWNEMRRRFYVTPSSYMELVRTYSRMLQENKKEFVDNKNRLLTGLFKLSEANSLVGQMQEELKELGPKIEEKAGDTDSLLQQLEKDQEAVEQVREIVEEEEGIMKKETATVESYADECEKDLASVLPNLQNAIASLDALDKASIAEIRVYKSPPLLVMNVVSAVCVLFQKKPDWPTAISMLGDQNFLKKLVQFDRNNVPDKVFRLLKRYSKHPDFNPETVGHVSTACRCICEWVLALEHYNEVYKMVTPKQRRVEEAKEALQLAQQNLGQKQASLKKIQDHLKKLQDRYQESVNQRESLKERKKLTALRLERASVLITALADEKVRWAESVNELDNKLDGLVGDTLISASGVAYLGSFTLNYRKGLVTCWVDMCQESAIPATRNFDMVKSVVDANQVLRWQTEGLPQDIHSTENAIFIKKGRKWPLLIDPQGQAEKWIKGMEGSRLKVVEASDSNYMRNMERAIRVGEPVLLKEVSEILDPTLNPILLQETFQRGGHRLMKLGDTEIEYNENFRLYMSSSLSNPHYLPAVYNKVNIINFTVTFDGLQEQLLSAVVSQERPKLEKQRNQLLESLANDLQLLRDLEDKALSLLNKSEGHILDDEDLVETLQKSKEMAGEIQQRITQSEETEKKLNTARMKYLPVATRGAVLYFVLADLSGIDVMYQFSLSWFQDMFTASINPSTESRPQSGVANFLSGRLRPSSRGSLDITKPPAEKEKDLSTHMESMIVQLTSSIYRVVSVALFAHHQLTFSFMLCTSIMRANANYVRMTGAFMGKIEKIEWQIFLQGNVMASMMDEESLQGHDGLTALQRLEMQSVSELTCDKSKLHPPKWITGPVWRQCQHLEETLPPFEMLCRSMVSNKPQWKVFNHSEEPTRLMVQRYSPSSKEGETSSRDQVVFEWEKLTQFQRLLLIKILRPELLTATCRQFVEDNLGGSYLSTGSFDLKEIYEESTAKTPLIFILSPGSDPASQLLRFARELRGSSLHLDMISLGRGQGPKAEELISKAQILKGRWVFLQNCHLAASWMPRLQAIVDSFSKPKAGQDIDPQFRLWLSSKPDPCFPISILQTGLKMTIEPPQGLKANLLRAFGTGGTGTITEKLYEDASLGIAWKKLLFGLCLFNGVLHERKKYGALGWNIPYEFNDSDLEVSILQLQMLLTEQDPIPWKALTFLTGEVTYGGRVTDEWDRRCLHSLLGKFYCPEALKPKYTYSADGVYHVINDSWNYSDVSSYIENLPDYDSPEIFGMTENAEKAFRQHQGHVLLETVLSVQPKVAGSFMGSGKSNDEMVQEMTGDILSQLPQVVEDSGLAVQPGNRHSRQTLKQVLSDEKHTMAKQMDTKGGGLSVIPEPEELLGSSALVTVLRQEIDRFNNLLRIIHQSLQGLILAVKGELVMSEPLEDAYHALLQQKVPAGWKTAAYESCKPLGSWIHDLVKRVEFFSRWAELIIAKYERATKPASSRANIGDLEYENMCDQPRSFWLPGFFFPQGFLTALLQNHARKLGISVDSLSFHFDVQKAALETEESLTDIKQDWSIKDVSFKGNSPPEDGVLVCGLFIDGARWDNTALALRDSRSGQRFCRLPQIHFIPVQNQSRESVSPRSDGELQNRQTNKQGYVYQCPLYRTSARAGSLSSTGHSTNFVTAVSLPSDHQPNFWVLRGVALLCQLDD